MKLKRRIGIALSLVLIPVLAVLFYIYAIPEDVPCFRTVFPVMGTVSTISVYSSEAELTEAFKISKKEFDAVEKLCSLYNIQSELSLINTNASHAPVKCSEDMWHLLMRSKAAYIESDGHFDITVKPLMDLWGFYRKRDCAPAENEIKAVMKRVGFDKVILDEKEKTILFSIPGMELDMGGIAKGYAVDRAAAAVSAAGIDSGVIDIGGNLRMLSQPPPGKKYYAIGIRDPEKKKKILPGVLKVAPGMAVSSSGDYERFVTYNGVRHSHIISPKTGYPANISAVTVVASKAMDADIFSTACCLGGKKSAKKLQKKFPEIKIRFTR
ncbi:MAG: FAD:protein FMN transferase [Lentisphaeria bacterium]|nr:FAD:protein FMN transferase [Lentisphaeria bacterium]